MKLLFFTGSRSEWGYIRPILQICKNKKIKYEICATNMHLLDSFGNSLKEIEKDGFKVKEKIYMALDGYNNFTMTKSLFILGEHGVSPGSFMFTLVIKRLFFKIF